MNDSLLYALTYDQIHDYLNYFRGALRALQSPVSSVQVPGGNLFETIDTLIRNYADYHYNQGVGDGGIANNFSVNMVLFEPCFYQFDHLLKPDAYFRLRKLRLLLTDHAPNLPPAHAVPGLPEQAIG